MKRWISFSAVVVSGVLALVVLGAWLRSYWYVDQYEFYSSKTGWFFSISSVHGFIETLERS